MKFITPQEVRNSRSFKKGYAPTEISCRPGSKPSTRSHNRKDAWPRGRLNYDFLESCKELICRIPHPTAFMKHKGLEYRLSVLPWSRGSYIDIRMYSGVGSPTSTGILLHLDIISKILPDLNALVRKLEMEDMRDPDQKAKVEVIMP